MRESSLRDQTLSCSTGSSEASELLVNEDLGKAFFSDITVTSNGENDSILNSLCQMRGSARYTVKCFHADDMDEASGGTTTLLIVFGCIIVFLCVLVIMFYSNWKKEQKAHNKTKSDIEDTEKKKDGFPKEYKDSEETND